MTRRWSVLVGVLGTLWTALMVALAPPASAHATLESTSPANGEHLATAPDQITLTFSESVNPVRGGFSVLDESGDSISDPDARSGDDASTVIIPAPDASDGVFTVTWRVVSADSHPIHGAFVYSVGSASAAPLTGPVNEAGADGLVTAAFWAARWGGYAGLAMLVGGAFFVCVCWPGGRSDPRVGRILRVGWTTSLVAAVGSLLLQGPNSDGSAITHVFAPTLLSETMGTAFGVGTAARIVLLVAAWFALRVLFGTGERPLERPRAVGLGVLGAALIATWGWTGHAHAGDQTTLASASDAAHLAAMGVWFAGLGLLISCVLPAGRIGPAQAARVLPRYSLTATAAVATLVVTGTYQAWREVRSLDALSGSDYGRLLIFKLAAFAVLLSLGAVSRSVVQKRFVVPVARASAASATTRRPTRDADGATRAERRAMRAAEERTESGLKQLRTSVFLESGLAVAVLGLTAALVATPPGQVSGGFEAAPVGAAPVPGRAPSFEPTTGSADLPLPDQTSGRVSVAFDQGLGNSYVVTVRLTDAAGQPLADIDEVDASLSLPDRDLGPLPVDLVRGEPGVFTAQTVTVPTGGTWTFELAVRVSEFDQPIVDIDLAL